MNLDFYDADILSWFMKDYKDKFLETAMDFGENELEAAETYQRIYKKVVNECHKEFKHK